jgi:hypothetical protein
MKEAIMPKYNVQVQLTGEDGNAFSIIGSISKALSREVGPKAASEWSEYAYSSESYDQLLQRAMETVEVL